MSRPASTTPSPYDRMSMSGDMLANSTGSLSGSRQQASQIAKTYRQAAQLFLTRRLPEALSTIEPIVIPSPVGPHSSDDELTPQLYGTGEPAPIASATKGTRVKVWSFYLTFLNAVVELGPEEGKHTFGSTKWKSMVGKTRDGSVWEEVVQNGYAGNEGAVDADVVINLATLLLTHAPSQRLTQSRLETYLSALSNPTFDIASHMATSRSKVNRFSTQSTASGTNTPRDLNTHLKLLELYTLHVLPRNGEWDYAREFIMLSEVLDEERKEGFLQALHGLKEDQETAALREQELARRQKEESEAQRRREEEEQRQAAEEAARRAEEDEKKRLDAEALRRSQQQQKPPESNKAAAPPMTRTRSALSPAPTSRSPAASRKKDGARARAAPAGVIGTARSLLANLQVALLSTAQGLRNNPLALLRTVLFILAFALALGRREIRERLKRVLGRGWDKTRQTVGMGVKVSYI